MIESDRGSEGFMINVESPEQMINDICNYLNLDPERLKAKIDEIALEATIGEMIDDQKFFELSEHFVTECDITPIDEVYFCHLTRSIDTPGTLLPLSYLLTTGNSFSDFLHDCGIEFSNNDEKLEMHYEGRLITDFSSAPHLEYRLGHCEESDFCINGYAFAIEPEKSAHDYFFMLKNGPELLQEIDTLLDTDFSDEYKRLSRYYIAISKVPLGNIIFDQIAEFNVEDNRTQKYLALCFRFLVSWYDMRDYQYTMFNEMLRVDDHAMMRVDHYVNLD